MQKYYYVYIMTNKYNNVFYVGITNNLARRTYEHKEKINEGFTSKYKIMKLIYYEIYEDVNDAIYREKRLKKWNRSWKIKLINRLNPQWRDLQEDTMEY